MDATVGGMQSTVEEACDAAAWMSRESGNLQHVYQTPEGGFLVSGYAPETVSDAGGVRSPMIRAEYKLLFVYSNGARMLSLTPG